MKQCFKCHCRKPLGEFYRLASMSDGHMNKCKTCTKADVTAHRQANLERVREYDRERGSLPHRIAKRRAYVKTDAGKRAKLNWQKKHRLEHPEKDYARYLVAYGIRTGKVKPWPVCEMPECDQKPEAHHPHYGSPLLVVWLCQAHHNQAHALTKEPA